MFVQTEITPNPNSIKFLPGKNVSNCGSLEITKKDETDKPSVNFVDASNNPVSAVTFKEDTTGAKYTVKIKSSSSSSADKSSSSTDKSSSSNASKTTKD